MAIAIIACIAINLALLFGVQILRLVGLLVMVVSPTLATTHEGQLSDASSNKTISPNLVLTVGVDDNPPMVFRTETGAGGIAIEFLEDVARRENWKLEYVTDSWSVLLKRLEAGEIDLIPTIAYSQERDRLFSFTRETLMSNWGVVFANETSATDSLLDLEGKRVALQRGDVYAVALEDALSEFDIPYTAVPVDSYALALGAVDEGRADAAVVSRLGSLRFVDQYQAVETGVILRPTKLRMATPKGAGEEVRATLDRHLQQQKSKEGSAFRQSLRNWLYDKAQSPFKRHFWIAVYVAVVLIILSTVAALLAALLKRQVSRKTAELATANANLLSSRARIVSIIENQADAVLIVSEDGTIRFVNAKVGKYFGDSSESLLGTKFGLPLVSGEATELELHRADGTLLPVEMRSQTFEFENERAFLTTIRDITERKRVEQERLDFERRFRQAFQTAPFGFALVDLDRRWLEVNTSL